MFLSIRSGVEVEGSVHTGTPGQEMKKIVFSCGGVGACAACVLSSSKAANHEKHVARHTAPPNVIYK